MRHFYTHQTNDKRQYQLERKNNYVQWKKTTDSTLHKQGKGSHRTHTMLIHLRNNKARNYKKYIHEKCKAAQPFISLVPERPRP